MSGEPIFGTIPCPPPGVHEHVPFVEYLEWDAVDASFLKAVEHTPHYAKARNELGEEAADAKVHYSKGRLFHCLVAEPEQAEALFVQQPDEYHHPDDEEGVMRKWNGNAKVCQQWVAANMDKTIVTRATMAEAVGMALRVRQHGSIRPLLQGCQSELSIVWVDKQTGLTCKGRYDLFKNGIVVDLKSTSSAASDRAFFSEAYRHKYHLQPAMYIDGGKQLGLFAGRVPWFAFVVVEGYYPYEVAVYDVQDDKDALSFDFLEYGRLKYHVGLQKVAYAIEHNQWDDYGPESMDMQLTYVAREELAQLTGGTK